VPGSARLLSLEPQVRVHEYMKRFAHRSQYQQPTANGNNKINITSNIQYGDYIWYLAFDLNAEVLYGE
jgi:hypothetical protein